MNPLDLEAVLRLGNAVPEAPHWARAVYERILSAEPHHKHIFIVEEGERLLGFIAAQIIFDVCELESIVVDITTRRCGVGRALLHTLFDWASSNNAVRVQLEVRSGNTRAIDFYCKSGFTQEGLRRAYYRDPEEDAVLMGRALVPIPDR